MEQQEQENPSKEEKAPTSEGNSSEKELNIKQNVLIAALGYIVFFLPLLAAKEDSFALYHANQGFLLFLTALGVNVVGSFLPIFGWFIVLPLGNLFVFVLAILGIVTALKEEKKPLPLIGGFSLLT